MDAITYKKQLVKSCEELLSILVPNHNKTTDNYKDILYSLPHLTIQELEDTKKTYEDMLRGRIRVDHYSMIDPVYRKYNSYIYN